MKDDRKIDFVDTFIYALYTNNKYKESVIIITHIFNDLMVEFVKEFNKHVNKVGVV